MNYLLPTARYEQTLLQYFAYGVVLGISPPHQIQQAYDGFFCRLLSCNNFIYTIFNNTLSVLQSLYLATSVLMSRVTSSVAERAVAFSGILFDRAKFFNTFSLQHFLNRPTSFYSSIKNSPLKSFFFSPLSNGFGFIFVSKQMIVRAIKILLSKSIPNTIIFSIITLGVYSIYRGISFPILFAMGFITFVHIIKKVLEVHPFFANSNTPSSIIFEAVMFRIKTSLFHRTPYLVKSSPSHSVFHKSSISNYNMFVKQFCSLVSISRAQLTDIWNKAHKK